METELIYFQFCQIEEGGGPRNWGGWCNQEMGQGFVFGNFLFGSLPFVGFVPVHSAFSCLAAVNQFQVTVLRENMIGVTTSQSVRKFRIE